MAAMLQNATNCYTFLVRRRGRTIITTVAARNYDGATKCYKSAPAFSPGRCSRALRSAGVLRLVHVSTGQSGGGGNVRTVGSFVRPCSERRLSRRCCAIADENAVRKTDGNGSTCGRASIKPIAVGRAFSAVASH